MKLSLQFRTRNTTDLLMRKVLDNRPQIGKWHDPRHLETWLATMRQNMLRANGVIKELSESPSRLPCCEPFDRMTGELDQHHRTSTEHQKQSVFFQYDYPLVNRDGRIESPWKYFDWNFGTKIADAESEFCCFPDFVNQVQSVSIVSNVPTRFSGSSNTGNKNFEVTIGHIDRNMWLHAQWKNEEGFREVLPRFTVQVPKFIEACRRVNKLHRAIREAQKGNTDGAIRLMNELVDSISLVTI